MNVIDKILTSRRVGHVTCAIMELPRHNTGREAADRVVQAHGLRGIASEWDEVSATDALAISAALLHRDLAYGSELIPLHTATDLVTQFFDQVPEPHTYFTNGEWSIAPDDSRPASLSSFSPISEATLDAGVVCLGDGRAALLWVQDED